MSKYTIIVEDQHLEKLVASVLDVLKNIPQIKFNRRGETVVIQAGDASPSPEADLGSRFERQFQQWKKETLLSSSGSEMFGHPAYRRIIEMGKPIIPFVLIKLKEDPQHLFYALYKITGENPIPHEHAGDLANMTADWINWGVQKGYLAA